MISIQTSLEWFISVLRVHSARLAEETSLLECMVISRDSEFIETCRLFRDKKGSRGTPAADRRGTAEFSDPSP